MSNFLYAKIRPEKEETKMGKITEDKVEMMLIWQAARCKKKDDERAGDPLSLPAVQASKWKITREDLGVLKQDAHPQLRFAA